MLAPLDQAMPVAQFDNGALSGGTVTGYHYPRVEQILARYQ